MGFNSPHGEAVDSNGNVFVSDTDNDRIQMFTNDGTFIKAWGGFNSPHGVAVDSNGNVFVVDSENFSIQKFTNDGAFLTAWGNNGQPFSWPTGIAVESSGKVFVSDGEGDDFKVFVWRPNVTSSINMMKIANQAIWSKVNVSLNEAATTAAQVLGNNSHAVAGDLGEENGYLVYNILVIDPSLNFSKVLVDPGNGKVLFNKQLSREDMMKDEMERHQKVMASMMMGGRQQGIGMMMGPMTAQAEQTDNITSSNVTSVLPTTTTITNTTSQALGSTSG